MERVTPRSPNDEGLAFWRAMHAEAVAQVARLTDAQLEAARPGRTTELVAAPPC